MGNQSVLNLGLDPSTLLCARGASSRLCLAAGSHTAPPSLGKVVLWQQPWQPCINGWT